MNIKSAICRTLLLALMLPLPALAESGQAQNAADQPTAASGFVYRPPLRGAPSTRIGGGTRSVAGSSVQLEALVPDHTGLTSKAAPTLYWYVSQPAEARLELTVIDEQAIDPVLEQAIDAPEQAGIHKLDLSTLGTSLEPDVEYRWFVSVILDPARRSNDITASGTIRRIPADSAVHNRVSEGDERTLARVYAEQGLWYDAIDALSRLIDRYPADSALRAQRAALLEQVGLQAAAEYDTSAQP